MRVIVIADRCQGHAMCVLACPDVFHLNDDDGHAIAIEGPVAEALENHVLQAQKSCPEQAIRVLM